MSEVLVNQREFFKEVSALVGRGQGAQALHALGDAIRRRQLDAEGMDKAGRRCQALFEATDQKIAGRILLLGQCTTTWLGPALTASAWSDGRALEVSEGAYDNVLQELLGAAGGSHSLDVVVLLPWNQRLLYGGSGRTPEQRVDEECAFWQQAWKLIEQRLTARIIQVGYDWMTPGFHGHGLGAKAGGNVGLIRAVNQRLRETLPPGAIFTDLEQISGEVGRARFYDARRYYWTKQPFSELGTTHLADHIAAGIRALMTGPKKVLVLDLDNTLWGGVVGETGPLGVTLGEGPDGEAFVAFQNHVKGLSDRGIVLAVASKNNDADAREPFEKNPNMVLSLNDFAQFEATWDPKAVSLRRIAKTLQLGLDSFVFFDDNPAEREHIRQALPEVAVVEVPEDAAEYVRALDRALLFEAVDITDEDRVRAEQYRSERRRRDAEGSFESLDAYLTSLEMVADVRAIDEADMDRVVQLLGKTNQFNLTTRRHGLAKVRQMLALPGTVGLTFRMADRFGDHGLVAVMLATPVPDADVRTLSIDTWLMSCRVISRTAEEFSLNTLVSVARDAGIARITGEYIPTAKNGLVKELYDRLGFERRGTTDAGGVEYHLDLRTSRPAKTFVQSSAALAQAR